jgi:hypothetical protein
MMKTNNQKNNENDSLVYIKLFVIVLILIFYAELYREYWAYYNRKTYCQETFCYYYYLFYN